MRPCARAGRRARRSPRRRRGGPGSRRRRPRRSRAARRWDRSTGRTPPRSPRPGGVDPEIVPFEHVADAGGGDRPRARGSIPARTCPAPIVATVPSIRCPRASVLPCNTLHCILCWFKGRHDVNGCQRRNRAKPIVCSFGRKMLQRPRSIPRRSRPVLAGDQRAQRSRQEYVPAHGAHAGAARLSRPMRDDPALRPGGSGARPELRLPAPPSADRAGDPDPDGPAPDLRRAGGPQPLLAIVAGLRAPAAGAGRALLHQPGRAPDPALLQCRRARGAGRPRGTGGPRPGDGGGPPAADPLHTRTGSRT